jgi:hypothetical protein
MPMKDEILRDPVRPQPKRQCQCRHIADTSGTQATHLAKRERGSNLTKTPAAMWPVNPLRGQSRVVFSFFLFSLFLCHHGILSLFNFRHGVSLEGTPVRRQVASLGVDTSKIQRALSYYDYSKIAPEQPGWTGVASDGLL